MKRLFLIAAIIVAATLPAEARATQICTQTGFDDFDADLVEFQLNAKGYRVSNVDRWQGCVRGFVTDEADATGMVFFDPVSLEPVSTGVAVNSGAVSARDSTRGDFGNAPTSLLDW